MPRVTLSELVQQKHVTIFTAVQIEAKAVARALGLRRASKVFWNSDENQGPPVSLYMIGMGASHLPAIEPSELRCILMVGLAGGLDPSLQIGDLVIDELSTFATELKAVRGSIYTSRILMATPGDKADCFGRSGAVAVDMENQIVREWSAKMDVPFLGIRAISDRADHSLDPGILNAIDEFGDIKPIQLAAGLVARPRRIASLIRVGHHAKDAAKRLGSAVAEIVVAIQ